MCFPFHEFFYYAKTRPAYASWDGFAFTLRAPRENGDHFVVLEPLVLDEFESFVKRTEQEIEEQRQRRERSRE